MDNSWYSFDVSPLWLAVVFAAAFLLAVLLYSKKGMPWGRNPNILMGFLRFSSIFLILLLLLNPLLRLNQNDLEKPIVVIAVDNSESITIRTPAESISAYESWLQTFSNDLEDSYEVETQYLEDADTFSFNSKTTNIDQLLRSIENIYEGENLSAVVLASDGIINQGQSPAFREYPFPIFTLGLGDTIPPKDIVLAEIMSNRVAYQGNQYPVQVNVQQKGFTGQEVTIAISDRGKVLDREQLTLDRDLVSTTFFLEADEPGLKRLSVAITPVADESSTDNNAQDVFVEVIEGKEKVLIVAPAPHPDISAIRSVLEDASNYETVLYIPGISTERPVSNDFDLIIEHDAFKSTQFDQFQSSSRWYIAGDQLNIGLMNNKIDFMSIQAVRNQNDLVKPSYNEGFSKFVLTERFLSRIRNYPPVTVPFGRYTITGPSEVLFYQQVGTIATDRPMLAFYDDGSKKEAVQLGIGIWQWKLQEAGLEEESSLFDEFVLKTVQYLSIKANKDRFIVKPRKSEYLVGDRIFIDTEVYNEIYERAYGNSIRLILKDENGNTDSFEMVDSPTNSSLNLGSRSAGVYEYTATTSLGSSTFTENGSFAVKDIQLEGINLAANHNLLRTLSKNTQGEFYHFQDRDGLKDDLIGQDFKNIIRTTEEFIPLISTWWIIGLIVLFLTTEWLLRKYLGAY